MWLFAPTKDNSPTLEGALSPLSETIARLHHLLSFQRQRLEDVTNEIEILESEQEGLASEKEKASRILEKLENLVS